MAKNKFELGKGIAALLGNIDSEVNKSPEAAKEVVRELSNSVALLPFVQIETNPWQPRNDFDEAALNELSESIKIHGLIQPITVRRMTTNQYQLISGERRLRASKLAGLTEIPAYVRIANDQEMLEMALVENIQREELNPVEIAFTYQRLIDECQLTHEKLSERVAKNRSTITNFLRLLKLPPVIQQSIKDKKISTGHAKVLVGIDNLSLQLMLHERIIKENLSVRDIENLARNYAQIHDKKKFVPKPNAQNLKPFADTFSSFFGTKVAFKRQDTGAGSVTITFKSDEELNRLLDLVETK